MHETTGRLARYAPLSGVVAVGLLVTGLAIVETQASSPGGEATPAEALAYLEANGSPILLGSWLCALGLLVFVWFLGSLRATLRAAEGRTGRFADLAFGGGLLTTAFLAAAVVPTASGAISTTDDHAMSGEAAQAMLRVGDAFFPLAFMSAAIPLATTAVVVVRTRVLPRWFGVASSVLAVGLLIPFVQWLLFGFVFPLWLVACSLLLLVRRREAASARVSAQAVAA